MCVCVCLLFFYFLYVCVQADACLCVHVRGTEGSGAAVCSTGWQGAVRMALFPASALK